MKATSFTTSLERRLAARSQQLEDIHLQAAIDAQLTTVTTGLGKNCRPIFDDYINPNSVLNCFSPFVPSSSHHIDALISISQLHGPIDGKLQGDVFLDIGCGDGRVCISVAKLTGCKVYGIDVSPACIAMAKDVADEEGLSDKCSFFEADATIDPDILLSETSSLYEILNSTTVVYLYIYPTLLEKLIPLLSKLTNASHNTRSVVTSTYHLTSDQAMSKGWDKKNDIQIYSQVFDHTNNRD